MRRRNEGRDKEKQLANHSDNTVYWKEANGMGNIMGSFGSAGSNLTRSPHKFHLTLYSDRRHLMVWLMPYSILRFYCRFPLHPATLNVHILIDALSTIFYELQSSINNYLQRRRIKNIFKWLTHSIDDKYNTLSMLKHLVHDF